MQELNLIELGLTEDLQSISKHLSIQSHGEDMHYAGKASRYAREMGQDE